MTVEWAAAGSGHRQGSLSQCCEGGQQAVGQRDAPRSPALCIACRLDHPTVVAPEVDGDDHVCGPELGDQPAHGYVVAIDQRDVVTQCVKIGRQLLSDAQGRIARQDEHPRNGSGQMGDDVGQRSPVECPQRCRHVVDLQLQVATDGVGGRRLANALGGGTKLAGQRVLYRGLQAGETLEAQLASQADHGRCPTGGSFSQVGDGSEGNELRLLEDDLRHASFSWRQ